MLGYGMTEVLITHATPHTDPKIGYCGRMLPHVQSRVICTETGKNLPPGERGELLLKTPTVNITKLQQSKYLIPYCIQQSYTGKYYTDMIF